MKNLYSRPETEIQEQCLYELLCDSAGGTLEDFMDGGEFVW